MYIIVAEKEDMGNKIAAALHGFKLPSGKTITSANLADNIKEVKALQLKQGYLDITFRGEPCKVTWALGHLYGLKDVFEYNKEYKVWSARPICFIPDKYQLRPLPGPSEYLTKKNDHQRQVLKELFSTADTIINATDDDREGEVIFAYIYEALKCKKPYVRIKLDATTDKGINTAFTKLIPSTATKNIEMAGRARGIYDWLIGTNLSTRATLKNPGNGVVSVGRIQTQILSWIVERELQIKNFKSEPFWTLGAEFTTVKGETYKATHKSERFKTPAEAKTVLDKINGKDGVITDIVSKKSESATPLLFSQTLLAIEANKRFGYTSDKTLEICQFLYDNGYATYPRTKSQHLNDDMEPVVIAVLKALQKIERYKKFLSDIPLKPQKKYFNSSKVESHYAIIPTGKIPGTLSEEQQNIFDLLAYSVIRTIYPNAEMENTTVTTAVEGELFISKGTTVIKPGWLTVGGKTKEELLPKLAVKEKVSGKYETKEGKTEPPKRYTDASLLAAMASAGKTIEDAELKKILEDPKVDGIGTDATRAGIIKTLETRKYIERQKKTILPTDKGIQFIQSFPVSEMKSAEFTAKMEQRLGNIARGEESFDTFIKDVERQTDAWCHIIEDSKATMGTTDSSSKGPVSTSKYKPIPCPVCGKDMIVKKGKFGEFYACTGYPACKTTQPIIKETAVKCPKCGKPIVERKSKTGKVFYGCSGYPDCTQVFWSKPVRQKCPQCGAIAVKNDSKRTKYKCSSTSCGIEFD